MHPKDAYLVLYNLACCAGWAAIWVAAIRTVVAETDAAPLLGAANKTEVLLSELSGSLSAVYSKNDVAMLLWYTQGAALLEIAHALFRLVRSPVMVTAMQVMSRIVALVAIAYAPAAQGACLCMKESHLVKQRFNRFPSRFILSVPLVRSMGRRCHDPVVGERGSS
jgi:Protein tyrosine phosphatase-like protein, PTPLA